MKSIVLISYDTWGNEKDGWDVNNLFTEASFQVSDDLINKSTCKEIVKLFHDSKSLPNILGQVSTFKIDYRKVYVDNSCYPYLEILKRGNHKPIGRVEIREGEVIE